MTIVEEVVPAALGGERVDRAAAIVTGLSRAAVARLVDAGSVQLDGRSVRAAERVEEGQVLTVELPASESDAPRPEPAVEVPVIHADDAVIVVDKPAGMVVHPGAGHATDTMINGLLARYPDLAGVGDAHRPGLVHRLDRGTSGLLVVARTAAAHEDLVRQMRQRLPIRSYTALVWGHLDSDAGTIDAPIGRSSRNPTRMAVTDRGRTAVTHYRVEDRFDRPRPCSHLSCRLETGRTHQIRVHLAAIGHPVVGDRDYGGARPGIDLARPFLHAEALSFEHPVSREALRFESPLPPDLEATLSAVA